ncbi:MAG: type II toxin-antitoxin system RelE/ParE family toxin [Candidatus Omnitrophota bacterium]|nr:type II toxin-antitoxin system RelE/ParE family toxin [Candidatus Omnitrophota bacterium]
MIYSVKWQEKAVQDLKSVDKKSASGLTERVKIYLSQDPLSLGKPLKGVFEGLHRYRFGDYRVIYFVNKKERAILILRIGKRKEVYNQKL